jgi:hypothetical protein
MSHHEKKKPGLPTRILLFPIALLTQIPLGVAMVGGLLIALLAFGAYYSLNSDFLGLAAPPWSKLSFSSDFRTVQDPDQWRWVITYESNRDSTFSGVARHVSHWREEDIPFATHDILVTTGEFSSQERVRVSVLLHTFTYRYFEDPHPSGKINLLHIIPASPEIYQQLLEVREWNQVTIRGREILRIDRYDSKGDFLGYWQDAGCNSILVNAVTIHAKGTPVP